MKGQGSRKGAGQEMDQHQETHIVRGVLRLRVGRGSMQVELRDVKDRGAGQGPGKRWINNITFHMYGGQHVSAMRCKSS